jgi:predicted RNA binding protein YcfA (HicA-like mRNA interferase family)
MSSIHKLHKRIANNQRNVSFADLLRLTAAFGYEAERIAGSHHIYRHPATGTKLNLQPKGKDAKPYQVRELLRQVERYNLTLGE